MQSVPIQFQSDPNASPASVMPTMNLEGIELRLQEMIAGLVLGEPLVLTKDGEPVATLTRSQP